MRDRIELGKWTEKKMVKTASGKKRWVLSRFHHISLRLFLKSVCHDGAAQRGGNLHICTYMHIGSKDVDIYGRNVSNDDGEEVPAAAGQQITLCCWILGPLLCSWKLDLGCSFPPPAPSASWIECVVYKNHLMKNLLTNRTNFLCCPLYVPIRNRKDIPSWHVCMNVHRT